MTTLTPTPAVAPADDAGPTPGWLVSAMAPDRKKKDETRLLAGRARCDTRAFLRRWHVTAAVTADAVLIVSELVTNAIKHSDGDIELRLLLTVTDVLLIEVIDDNPKPAKLRVADSDDTSGRGLNIVQDLVVHWDTGMDGRATWAVLRAQGEAA